MKKIFNKHFEVTFIRVVERKVTALVKAENPEEAILKVKTGDTVCNDEQEASEICIECKEFLVRPT